MLRYSCLLVLIGSLFINSDFIYNKKINITGQTPVREVLTQLGEPMPNHTVNESVKGVSAEKGKAIVETGFANPESKLKLGKQSKHFVCTSCHNTVQEDFNLKLIDDPEARLMYAKDKNIPFLQGTTFHGIVNRETFYNGDYQKKYQGLVTEAYKDMREAIQVCAVYCSSGRPLKDWEMESVLAYFWTLELKLEDLNLGEEGMEKLQSALNGNPDKDKLIQWIKNEYAQASPATFLDNHKIENYEGDIKSGKEVYDLGCMHCHENQRYSFFELDHAMSTFRYLKNNIDKIYHVSRKGTYPIAGKRAYMPNYTKERMSPQQMEDLKAYIYKMAK